jgi:hypothetical protein
VRSVTVFVGVGELVESTILGVQQGAVLLEKVVVDHLSHCHGQLQGRIVG